MREVEEIKDLVVKALEDMKAVDLKVLDVRGTSSVTDFMVIVSGTSDRHVKAMANNVVVEAKKQGIQPLGVEGDKVCEWVLVDLGDVVVHVMLPDVRDFYQLEKLWETGSIEELAEARPAERGERRTRS
jgi:ribosome-associated protein